MALTHESANPRKWSNPVLQFHELYLFREMYHDTFHGPVPITIIELQLRVYY